MSALVLISCSATKKTDGKPEYHFNDSILSIFGEKTRSSIYGKRQKVFDYLKKGNIIDLDRAGWNRKDHNVELKEGPDLFPDYISENNLYAYCLCSNDYGIINLNN